MIDRQHIEEFLKINGVDVSAPDEEIKSILISARWNNDDVETALLVLRENTKSHATHVDSLHKVFQSDDKMSPEAISALLGVDIEVSTDDVTHGRTRKGRSLSMGQALQISLISLALSMGFVFASMWYFEMGIFHITMR